MGGEQSKQEAKDTKDAKQNRADGKNKTEPEDVKDSKERASVVPPQRDLPTEAPVLLGEFYLIQELGKGAFGQAFLAVRRRDVKELETNGLTRKQLFLSQ